jgi:hypothetical protein
MDQVLYEAIKGVLYGVMMTTSAVIVGLGVSAVLRSNNAWPFDQNNNNNTGDNNGVGGANNITGSVQQVGGLPVAVPIANDEIHL